MSPPPPQIPEVSGRVGLLRERLVPLSLAFALLTAAALKAHQFLTEPSLETGILGSSWFRVGLIQFELVLGGWLASARQARTARITAAATFAIFLLAALYQAGSGAASCACAGKLVKIPPMFAALFDLGALIALSIWKPPPNHANGILRRAMLPAAAASSLIFLTGFSAAVVKSTSQAELLIPSSKVLDMGVISARGSNEIAFTVRNPGTESVILGRVKSSCPCLRLKMPQVIAPMADTPVRALLDLSREPDFVGDLAIDVQALTTAGEVGFALKVDVQVSRE